MKPPPRLPRVYVNGTLDADALQRALDQIETLQRELIRRTADCVCQEGEDLTPRVVDLEERVDALEDKIVYTLALSFADSADPVSAGAPYTSTATVTVGGSTQTDLVLEITTDTEFSGAGLSPVDGSLDGWTNSTGWTSLLSGENIRGYTATFTRSSHAVGSSTLTFTQATSVAMTLTWGGTVLSDQCDAVLDSELTTVT